MAFCTSLRPIPVQETERCAVHPGFPHMDLISIDDGAGKRRSSPRSPHPGSRFRRTEHRLCRKETHSPDLRHIAFHPVRIQKATSQHLVAAADPQHRGAPGMAFLHCRLQTGRTEPEQIGHRALGPRQHNHVWTAQFPGPGHVADPQRRMFFQRCEIREVGDAGQPDHSDIDGFLHLLPVQGFRQTVFFVHIHPDVGNHPQYRNAGALFQHGKAGS